MTLAPVLLDDLTWDQMVQAIRRRIPAESSGNWTLHAPVDPGITFLDLFAFLAEQRLYWLDQVPDAFVVAVLKLLGLDGPQPAVPAATVLQITSADQGKQAMPTVPAGTAFTRDPRGEVVFTLDDPVTVLPVAIPAVGIPAVGIPAIGIPAIGIPALETGGQDQTADLLAGREVDLLPAGGGPGEARITLDLTAPVLGGQVCLLIELADPQTPAGTAQAAIPPAWSPDAVDGVPPPAELTWAYDDDSGTRVQFDAAEVTDGTQGLRRSGIVRLPVPESWKSWAEKRTLLLRTDQATFAAPPRLRQLKVNVAVARNWQHVTAAAAELAALCKQVSDWLPLPGQHLDLPHAQGRLLDASSMLLKLHPSQTPPEQNPSLTIQERDGQEHQWTAVPDFVFSGREDRVFVIDRAAGALRFGDGRTGRIPVPDPDQRDTALSSVAWTLGGGVGGNGGTTPNWRSIGVVSATASNVVPAEGGADAETIAQARVRAGAALNAVHRAVTPADHETIAKQAPGVAVARAHAAVGDHPGFPCTLVSGAVSVYIVPAAPRGDADWDRADFVEAPRPDPGMLSQVRTVLGQARLLGEELFVREPRYRTARLRVEVTGTPRDPATARAKMQRAVRQYLDPLVGGDDSSGWPFGAPLRPSALLRAAQRVAGHDSEVASVAIALDDADSWENCHDVVIGAHELVVVPPGDVRVRFGPGSSASTMGGLP
jgi:predicted phage baseplate assembly protein